MSRGSPDYIGKQSFPLYGPFTTEYNVEALTTTDLTEVFSLSGAGYILSGFVWINGAASIRTDKIIMTIDSGNTLSKTVGFYYDDGFIKNPSMPLSLINFDAAEMFAVFMIGTQLTFEESLKIEYDPADVAIRDIKTLLWYSKVE